MFVNSTNLSLYQIIYNAVLRARDAVFEAVRPGADWRGLHILANRCVIKTKKFMELSEICC